MQCWGLKKPEALVMGSISVLGNVKMNLDSPLFISEDKNGQLCRLNKGFRLKFEAVTNMDLKIQ